MFARFRLSVDISIREGPFVLSGAAGLGGAAWTHAPLSIAVPTAVLMMLRFKVAVHHHPQLKV